MTAANIRMLFISLNVDLEKTEEAGSTEDLRPDYLRNDLSANDRSKTTLIFPTCTPTTKYQETFEKRPFLSNFCVRLRF